MSDLAIETHRPHTGPNVSHTPTVAGTDSSLMPDFSKSKGALYIILFFGLLQLATTHQEAILNGAKEITENAAVQNKLNKENAAIKFAILPDNATTDDVNLNRDENEQAAAEREDKQSELITTRQSAQVTMTRTSTDVNILQQGMSQLTGVVNSLGTLFKVIDWVGGSNT